MEHVGGGGEARRVAAQHRLMQQVPGDHAFAEAVWADNDDVGGLLEEGEGEQLLQQRAIELFRPAVVEVGHGLEGAEPGVILAALEAALQALALLDFQNAQQPRLGGHFLQVGEQSVQIQPPQALLERIRWQTPRGCQDRCCRRIRRREVQRQHLTVHRRSPERVLRNRPGCVAGQ